MSNLMRPCLAVLLAIGAFAQMPIFTVTAAEREATVVDGIAAVVNGEVITYSQVRALSAPQERMLRQQYTGQELASKLTELRELAVKDLIDRRLVIQAFKKESFEIPDHLVDMRIQEIIRESFGGDRNTFVKTLEAQNFTLGEFKQKEMEKIIVGAMKGHNVKTNSVVSPTKIEEYYRKHRDEFTSKEQIKLRMIMISGHKDTANAPAQKELAEEVLGKLASGAEFEQMAQMYSEDSTKDNGGDWGWIERKTLAEPLEKFAFNMPVARISNIIDYAGNYYILKVDDKHGGTTKSLNEVRADIEKKLVQEEAQQIQERWLASLRQKAYIKTF
jgi:peptidyl-prolyl cis-trans isomerase SurA